MAQSTRLWSDVVSGSIPVTKRGHPWLQGRGANGPPRICLPKPSLSYCQTGKVSLMSSTCGEWTCSHSWRELTDSTNKKEHTAKWHTWVHFVQLHQCCSGLSWHRGADSGPIVGLCPPTAPFYLYWWTVILLFPQYLCHLSWHCDGDTAHLLT